MKEKLQLLLDKASIIKLRQDALKAEEPFNVFRVLRAGHEEVSLHSRFLYELLNPKGTHGMGSIFLQRFAEVCNLPAISFDTVHVLREHASIDILIRDYYRAIVIENKIYAGDQERQLERYHTYVKNRCLEPTICYLTLDGREPSPWSMGNLTEKAVLLSYDREILPWLTLCIKEAALKPALRETLAQYQALVNQLTGNSMDDAEKHQVLNLMAQGDNATSAALLVRNWNHVRWHTEWDFWNELLAVVETRFQVSPDNRFTPNAIDKLVHGGNNKDWWYGLNFSIGSLFNTEVTFQIERGESEPVYYGLFFPSVEDAIKDRMRVAMQRMGAESNESWAGYNYTSAGIDFWNFDNPVTLQLANKDARPRIVGALWVEIQTFVTQSIQVLQAEFGTDFVPKSV